MRVPRISLIAICICGTLLSGCVSQKVCTQAPSSYRLTNVRFKRQKTPLWCWAAVGEMIMRAFGTKVTQCDQANHFWRRTPCCDDPTPKSCLQTGWPRFSRYGFNYETTGKSGLAWETIKEEIGCRHRPIAAGWQPVGGGVGHIEVIIGYDETDGEKRLAVLDPLELESSITYDEYLAANGDYAYLHDRDYYRIHRKGRP